MDQKSQQLQRIGISLETGLLDEFDAFISRHGYTSRSEAIRDLIRDRLTADQLDRPDTEAIAGVFVVYDHHRSGLTQKLVELQHSHLFKTISSMHVHIGHHDCLEVILLKGNVGEIVKLGDKIVSLKGVKIGKVNLISVTE